jgi:hypothetical protein
MFAPRIAKPQTKAAVSSSTSRLPPQHSTPTGHRIGHVPVEQALFLQRTIGNQATLRLLAHRTRSLTESEPHSRDEQEANPASEAARRASSVASWDFSKIPVFPPERASQSELSLHVTAAPLPGTIQPKLTVGATNDPLEAEADHVADQVMRMPDSALSVPRRDNSGVIRRKCACEDSGQPCASCASEKKDKLMRSARSASEAATRDQPPPVVDDVLRSPGQPLDAGARGFFEPRFRRDFADVRIHDDLRAARSAREVGALAYTVGQHVVVDPARYRAETAEGRRLLAHELTHVIQQNVASSLSLQRACRSAAQCGVTNPGSSQAFGTTVEAESEAIASASGGVAVGGGPTSCTLPRHGERAVNVESLATGSGLAVAVAPGIAGFFINACLSPNDGANNALCSQFPGGPPGGAPPDKSCVQLHTTDEDKAKALVAKPKPLNDVDQRSLLQWASLVKHESQHSVFDPKAGTVVPASGGCDITTAVPVPTGGNVEGRLSEISAEIAEYDVYFRNSKQRRGDSEWALQTEEHDIAIRGGENILGNIKDLQCACDCGVVAKFVEQVFDEASSSWTDEEKKRFKKHMTDFMPSFWPPALQRT